MDSPPNELARAKAPPARRSTGRRPGGAAGSTSQRDVPTCRTPQLDRPDIPGRACPVAARSTLRTAGSATMGRAAQQRGWTPPHVRAGPTTACGASRLACAGLSWSLQSRHGASRRLRRRQLPGPRGGFRAAGRGRGHRGGRHRDRSGLADEVGGGAPAGRRAHRHPDAADPDQRGHRGREAHPRRAPGRGGAWCSPSTSRRTTPSRCWPTARQASATCSRSGSATSTSSLAPCTRWPAEGRCSTRWSSRRCSRAGERDGPLLGLTDRERAGPPRDGHWPQQRHHREDAVPQ